MIAICAAGAMRSSPAHADARDARDGREDGWVVVGGGAEDHDHGVVDAAVAAVAHEVGWSLPREPVAKQDTDRLLDCSDPDKPFACVPPSIARRGIRRIFVFAIDNKQADSGAPMLVITARLIVASPPALVVRQRFCEHCADDRLTEASTELARQLLRDLAVRSGRTILDVESSPSGARITLDGRPVGATNATFNTFPGSHVVLVDKAGYRSEARTVIAREGKTAEVAVTLVPADRALPADRSARLVSGVLVGGGILAIIAGGILLELGTRGGSNDRYRYAGATPAGAVIGVAGAAACAAGVYVWWHVPASSGSAPAAGVGSGAVAGWGVQF
jgi:hypothetical protein